VRGVSVCDPPSKVKKSSWKAAFSSALHGHTHIYIYIIIYICDTYLYTYIHISIDCINTH
jgi:hypothetical protein